MFTRILVQIEMKKPTGTPRTTSLTVGAKSISPAISISPSATADVLGGQNTFFPKNFFRLSK